MDFIARYLQFNSGNMAPQRCHLWTALSILSMAVGRRIYVQHGQILITPQMYICLVGPQGIRKGTAKDIGEEIFTECFPSYPIGANVMSREQIVSRMSGPDGTRSYTDENGFAIEWHPLAFFVNELKNFMSINPGSMIEFLTDIYDRKFFKADTIKHGAQPIINPFVSILACETPAWIIDKLKLNIISGGFSRRLLFIYETEEPEKITFPYMPVGGEDNKQWCKEHLVRISTLAGPFTWTNEAKVYFDLWFRSLPKPVDEILAGFYIAKDVLVQKVAMMYAVAQPEPKLVFTKPILEVAIATLESIEENLSKLTIGAGRNQLAVPQQKLFELIERNGGCMMEREWHRHATKELNEIEYSMVKRMFKDTRQLYEVSYRVNGKVDMALFTSEKREELIKEGKWAGEK